MLVYDSKQRDNDAQDGDGMSNKGCASIDYPIWSALQVGRGSGSPIAERGHQTGNEGGNDKQMTDITNEEVKHNPKVTKPLR